VQKSHDDVIFWANIHVSAIAWGAGEWGREGKKVFTLNYCAVG